MLRDLKYAVRTLRRDPVFVIGVVTTFALAIGATAAMFGLVNRLMLSAPPGIVNAERLARVRVSMKAPDGSIFAGSTTSYPVYRALYALTSVFDGVAAARTDSATVGRGEATTTVARLGATGDYFRTLGATPKLGRFFGESEDATPTGTPVVVLSHAYWMRTYAGDRNVLGKELMIDEQPFTIIGVASRGFNGDQLGAVDVFVPMSASFGASAGNWSSNTFQNIVTIVARLRDGMTVQTAQQAASTIFRDDNLSGGRTRSVELAPMIPGKASLQSPQTRVAVWSAGVAVIVLLIAIANAGTLLALRQARRRRDVAVRLALGASQGALARQLLMESMLLAVTGAAAGLVLSRWFSQIVRVTLMPGIAGNDSVVDGRVLVVSVAIAIVSGLAAGVAPLILARKVELTSQLRSGNAHGASGRLAFHKTLVGVQVALCTVLVVGASLFVRSLQRVQSQDLGMSISQVLYVTLDFRGFITGAERDMTYSDAVERVKAIPGVGGASVAAGIPFGPHNIPPVSIPGVDGQIQGAENQPVPVMYGATPEYQRIMGVQLVSGRLINDGDQRGSPLVVTVNETMAALAWPGQSAIGKCVRAGFGTFPPNEDENPAASAPCRTVVGVVRDSRARSLRPEGKEDHIMQYYVPFAQLPDAPFMQDPSYVMGMLVLVNGNLAHTSALVAKAIHSGSAVPVVAKVRPYQDLIDPQLRSWRLGATLFSAFSTLALGIAGIGLFAVVSYVVAQRTREIGVRLALGGTGTRIARLIVGDSLKLAAIGVAAGAVGAFIAGPLLASMLFQTSAREPMSLLIAIVVLMLTTLIAAAIPALRAGNVSPQTVLRES